MAGCTLLAVGNGAPDIFTAHAAMQGQEDLPLLLSALLGAALLTLTAVLASVLLVNKVPHAQLPKLAPQGRTAGARVQSAAYSLRLVAFCVWCVAGAGAWVASCATAS